MKLLIHVKFLSGGVGELKLETLKAIENLDQFIISFHRHCVVVTITYDMSLELDIQQSLAEYNVMQPFIFWFGILTIH